MRRTLRVWVFALVGVAVLAMAASAANPPSDIRELRELVLKLQDQVQAQQRQLDDPRVVMQEAGLADERGSSSRLSSFLESTDFSGWVSLAASSTPMSTSISLLSWAQARTVTCGR